ncbi:aldehyde dehydrogenase [Streptomyces sp. NPDC004690]
MVWQGRYAELFVGGRWVAPSTDETIEVVSPFTEEPLARVPSGSRPDMDRAVAAARKAFDEGPWPRMQLSERIDVLRRLADALAAQEDVVAGLITDEMGCPITQTVASQAGAARALLETFVELAPQYAWETVRRSAMGNALVTREPIGVVAAVVPWNAPLSVAMLKLGPALVAGCTVVLKPSPEAPLDSYLLAEMTQSAGIPDGVVNIVPADRDVSEYLVTHPAVDKVSFTGSTVAGRRIASLCGNDLRRVTLELGGKSAAIILDDADLDHATRSIKTLSLRYNGQACNNKTRILVPRTREAEILDRLTTMTAGLVVGDPRDPATEIGPLVSVRQRERVEGYIASGREQGAKVAFGGGRPSGLDRGWFVEPTVFTGVEPGMKIAQEEIFGPVLTVLTYADEDQAVEIANDSAYGLSGAVYGADPRHALDVARRIHTGSVEVNGSSAGFHAPLGGFKCSGIGREAGLEGFDAFVELKSYGLPAEVADALS